MKKLHMKKAIHACQRGGIIAYPTEAVFGLGCIPFYEHSVQRILKLKSTFVMNPQISRNALEYGAS